MSIFRKREDEDLPLFLVRWTARVLSVAILFLLALFVLGEGATALTAIEWTGIAFFPVGVAVGLLVGWKNELIGGSVAVASLAGFYLIYGLALTGRLPQGVWFAVFTMPGFLFLAYGLVRVRVFPRPQRTTLVR